MFHTRVLSALVLMPIVGWVVWTGEWWLFATVVVVAGIAGYEFSELMRRGNYAPSTFFILALIGALALDAQFPNLNISQPVVTAILLLSISLQLFRHQDNAPVVNWALTMAGGLYLGWLSWHVIRLRALPHPYGLAWTTLALLVTWGGDTLAYFVGSALGRRRLWPRLSPGKTWEGLLGGTVGSLMTGGLVGYLAMQWTGIIGLERGLLVGCLGAVVGPFGDLAISLIKRQVGAKDSGHIIPGHGGMLDRSDSLLFIVVITYYYAIWVGG